MRPRQLAKASFAQEAVALEAFTAADLDESGVISKDELTAMLRKADTLQPVRVHGRALRVPRV